MRFLILVLLLSACAPKSNDVSTAKSRGLLGAWEDASQSVTIDDQGIATVRYLIGGACTYQYSTTISDPNQHDFSAGTISFANGAVLESVPGMSCALLNGTWTYAVLISNSLQICNNNGCLAFE